MVHQIWRLIVGFFDIISDISLGRDAVGDRFAFFAGLWPARRGLLHGQQTGTASGLGTMTSQPSGVVMRPQLVMTCTSSAL